MNDNKILQEFKEKLIEMLRATEGTENSIVLGYGMGLKTALDMLDDLVTT